MLTTVVKAGHVFQTPGVHVSARIWAQGPWGPWDQQWV